MAELNHGEEHACRGPGYRPPDLPGNPASEDTRRLARAASLPRKLFSASRFEINGGDVRLPARLNVPPALV